MKHISLKIAEKGRLDKVLALAAAQEDAAVAAGLSRARLQQLIREGCVRCAGVVRDDPNHKALAGEVYEIFLPSPLQAEPEAQEIPLTVLYEDDDLLVLDKPAGLVVHPAAGNQDKTLVNALLHYCGGSLSGIGGVARPGIVHRLDKETSGLMVVAKNDRAHQGLTAQFSDRSLSRVYRAVVWGVPDPVSGEVEAAIGRHPRARQKMAVVTRGGKEALTRYKVIEVYGAALASLVECRLATGRTHQIRVHMAHIGHPVAGDPLYAGRRGRKSAQTGPVARLEGFPRQALHAGEISFIHPVTRKKMHFESGFPNDMKTLIAGLKKA
jgi:23S rRNA pseudouridine1911/1915/1917 synthase